MEAIIIRQINVQIYFLIKCYDIIWFIFWSNVKN